MINKIHFTVLLNIVFGLISTLFVLDQLYILEIKNELLKSIIYFGFLILTPGTLFWNFLTMKSRKGKLLASILPVVSLAGILIVGPIEIVFSSSAWKTQTVLYEHGHLSFKRVEFQMKDMGALGYQKRTVKIIYLTDFFMITEPVDENIDKRGEWIKVNKEVNEIGFKY